MAEIAIDKDVPLPDDEAGRVQEMLERTLEEPSADPESEVAAWRAEKLEGIDPAVAELITDAELEEIEREEREVAQAQRKKKALASVREAMKQKARVENNLVSANVLLSDAEKKRRNAQTTFRINLPRGGGALGLRVDGFLYQQGTTYTRPVAVAESLANQHYRVWLEEIKLTTLDQHKRGNSAVELAGQKIPPFYIDEGR